MASNKFSFANRSLTAFCFSSILLVGGNLFAVEVVAHWTFDDRPSGSLATSVRDIVSGVVEGTQVGDPRHVTMSDGSIGVRFDGDDMISLVDRPAFEISGNLTLESIFQIDEPHSSGGTDLVFRGDRRGGHDPYQLMLRDTGQLSFMIDEERPMGRFRLSTPDPIPLGRITHVAGVLNADTGLMQVYIDGGLVAETVTDHRPFVRLLPQLEPALSFGGWAGSREHFKGIIGEVRISNDILGPGDFLNNVRLIGDSNLDGRFNSGDLVEVFQAGQYEDGIDGNSGWAEGDWDGDGDFTTSDLTKAFQDGRYDQNVRDKAVAIPEPHSSSMLFAGLMGLAMRRRGVGKHFARRSSED